MEPNSAGEHFRRDAERILRDHPQLRYEWRGENELFFPSATPSGFDIEIVLEPDTIVVNALGAHEHFAAAESSPAEAAEQSLGYIRDLLSSGMRIRERRAGSSAYRWTLEIRAGQAWEKESSTGLLFFNYFGKRSERIYQNDQLPDRLDEDSGSSIE